MSALGESELILDQDLLEEDDDDLYDPNNSDYDPNDLEEAANSPARHFGSLETIERTPQIENAEQEEDLEDLKKLELEISNDGRNFVQPVEFDIKNDFASSEGKNQKLGVPAASIEVRGLVQRPFLEDSNSSNFLNFRPELRTS